MTGIRYYTLNGVKVAARTGASSLAFLAADQQGTDSVAIDSVTLAITRRYYDPYGNPRGTSAPGFPVGTKGFVGGVNDTATGLTNLGAREYQPGTGSFLSPDPILKPFDPQDLDPYAYAKGNPATYADPTGPTSALARTPTAAPTPRSSTPGRTAASARVRPPWIAASKPMTPPARSAGPVAPIRHRSWSTTPT